MPESYSDAKYGCEGRVYSTACMLPLEHVRGLVLQEKSHFTLNQHCVRECPS